MGESQRLQRMEVLAVDHSVIGFVTFALDFACADKAGVDIIAKLGRHDKVFHGHFVRFRLCRPNQLQLGRALAIQL